MCRMAAYLGPPAPLAVLLSDPPHALTEQAWRPRLQHEGHVNVDGTGVAWWPEGEAGAAPLRYVTELPPWSDPNLPALARRLRGVMQLAAVRSATPGLPCGAGAVAPFVHGRLAVAHNGRVGGFHGPAGRRLVARLAERLPADLYAGLGTLTDAAVLALAVAGELRARPGGGLLAALAAAVQEAEAACAAAGEGAALTLLAADGQRVAGVRSALGSPSPTLFTREGPGAVLAASEPLDSEPGWVEVPDRHLVELTAGGARHLPLDAEAPA